MLPVGIWKDFQKIKGFNAFVRAWHPSYLTGVMLESINSTIRIGAATVLPGDIVLGKKGRSRIYSSAFGRKGRSNI